jgi:hypothetical protein
MKVPGLRFRGVVAMKKRMATCCLIRPFDIRKVQSVVVETAILLRIKRNEQTEYPAAGVPLPYQRFNGDPAPDGGTHPSEGRRGCCRSIDLQHPEPG